MFREANRDALWVSYNRQIPSILLFGPLDAAFNIANGLEVLAQFGAIARPKSSLHLSHRLGHRIQNATVLLLAGQPCRGISTAAVTKHTLENCSRIIFHRQGSRCTTPGDGIDV